MATVSVTGTRAGGRLSTLSGAAFVIATLVSIIAVGGATPDPEASAAEVASFYGAHDNRQFAAALALAAAVPLLVIFGATLSRALRPSEDGRHSIWHTVLTGGSLLAGAGFILAAFVHLTLADGADTLSAGTLQVLNLMDGNSWLAFNSGLGVMMLGAAGSMIPLLRADRLMGWAALVLGLALFIPFASFFALLLAALWIIAMSVVLFRRDTTAL